MVNDLILPDSRLHDEKFGCVMMDWPVGDKTFRVEARPAYCPSCGKKLAMIPTFVTFGFLMCDQCFAEHGLPPGTFAQPDEAFCKAVEFELEARFGHNLDSVELATAVDQGKLGRMLELLERESPYEVWR